MLLIGPVEGGVVGKAGHGVALGRLVALAYQLLGPHDPTECNIFAHRGACGFLEAAVHLSAADVEPAAQALGRQILLGMLLDVTQDPVIQ